MGPDMISLIADCVIGAVITHKKTSTDYKIVMSVTVKINDEWRKGIVYTNGISEFCRPIDDFQGFSSVHEAVS